MNDLSEMPKPTLVYIFSAGHSGSTLLSSMIGRHELAFNAGEIGYLPRFMAFRDGERTLCSCGAIGVLKCPFWSRVDAKLREDSGRSLHDLQVGLSEGNTADDRLLFQTIAEVAGVSVIVDTSKNYRRLQRLMKDPAIRILLVILIADPRKIVHSMHGRISAVKYALRLNRLGLRMRKAHRLARGRGLEPVVVRYDEFAENPARSLEKILGRVGLNSHEGMLDWGGDGRHDLGGNPMKFGRTSEIRKDERWRTAMSAPVQATVLALSPIFQLVSKWLAWREQALDRRESAKLQRLKDAA